MNTPPDLVSVEIKFLSTGLYDVGELLLIACSGIHSFPFIVYVRCSACSRNTNCGLKYPSIDFISKHDLILWKKAVYSLNL